MIWVECRKLWFNRGTLFSTFSFYSFVLFSVSLVLGSDESVLKTCSSALLWILVSLTTFFSTPLLLKTEAQSGLLDEILLYSLHPGFSLLSKVIAEWFLIGVPLCVFSVFLSPLFAQSMQETFIHFLTLLVGFPALSALSLLGGLMTLHARGGSLLLSFLILPFSLPLFLFALSVMEMTRLGLDSLSPFCLLIGTSLFLVTLSIGAGTWALKQTLEG